MEEEAMAMAMIEEAIAIAGVDRAGRPIGRATAVADTPLAGQPQHCAFACGEEAQDESWESAVVSYNPGPIVHRGRGLAQAGTEMLVGAPNLNCQAEA